MGLDCPEMRFAKSSSGLYLPARMVRQVQRSPMQQGGQQQVMLAQRISGSASPTLIASASAGSANALDATTSGVDTTGANSLFAVVSRLAGQAATVTDSR